MNELRIRPKSNYLKQANWQELYVLTEHWHSDLEFFKDELQFLTKLISKYFIWMTKEENISKVQKMVLDLSKLGKQRQAISSQVKKHMVYVQNLLENAFSHDETAFRDEHSKLEENIATFSKDFRSLKKQIFNITEHVMESEKLQHLLTT